MLEPFLDCDHKFIREELRAMLVERDQEAKKKVRRRQREGWTTYQIDGQRLVETLRCLRNN